MLSVNIVCQDEAETLPYTLYCIEQVLKPYLSEVVIVDGGSRDDTINVIEEWRRRLPIVFLYHVFDAPGKQKNRGLERCTGKWVLGVDADMTFTRNLGDLLASGHFDSHEVWDFLMYYTVIDEYHAFEPSRGTTTRLWQNKFRFERDFHESITSESKKVCKEAWMFENSHLQTRGALRNRGERWQPFAARLKAVGPGPGGPARYVMAEQWGRVNGIPLPDEVAALVIPRETEELRKLDAVRAEGSSRPVSGEMPDWIKKRRQTMRTDKFPEVCDPEWQRMWGLPHRGHRSDILRDAILSIWPDVKSVVDLGCSVGGLLESFSKLGIEIWGVDCDRSILLDGIHCVPVKFLEIHDLREAYYPPRKFDVCICTDTLEHIPQDYVDIAIESMGRCSNKLYMNIPGAGGGGGGPAGHINMRPLDKWQKDFERRGFERITDLPPLVASWENALVMRRK